VNGGWKSARDWPLLPDPTPKGTTRVFERSHWALAELGHPPNQNRPLIEKPGKMAGLIESISWTNAETTKLNNAQWRLVRAGQRNPPAMTKTSTNAPRRLFKIAHLLGPIFRFKGTATGLASYLFVPTKPAQLP
jgi:hypothetical protein